MSQESIVDEMPISLMRSISKHYFYDARDFAARFDVLWENQTHKTGRIKSFVDLHMSAECVLKAHIFLGRHDDDPKEVYRLVRKAGHSIGALADTAAYLSDRTNYDAIKVQLDEFSVLIRYSLDAYDMFFPSLLERDEAKLKYSETIGNHLWVLGVRAMIGALVDSVADELTGLVSMDIAAILENERQMREFMDSVAK
jgi:hypothetical protein